MKSARGIFIGSLLGLLLLFGWQSIRSEETTETAVVAPSETPALIGVTRSPAPARLLTPDAIRLMDQLREQLERDDPGDAIPAEQSDTGPSRVIRIERPVVTNPGSLFLFEDVTGRRPERSRLTLEQRRENIERYRKSRARAREPESDRP